MENCQQPVYYIINSAKPLKKSLTVLLKVYEIDNGAAIKGLF